jgi:acylphosphatase
MSYKWFLMVGMVMVLVLSGCATTAQDGAMESEPKVEPAVASVADTKTEQAPAKVEFDLGPHEKEGFVLIEEDGRLWVFHEGSADLEKFRAEGEPAKQVIRPAAGMNGVTLKATASETIDEYLTTLPGWVTIMEDGRLWVFKAGSEDLEKFLSVGEPAKQVVRPLAGPYGLTIKGVDTEQIDEYLAAWEAR